MLIAIHNGREIKGSLSSYFRFSWWNRTTDLPKAVEGRLISGHQFSATPNMTEQCTACHGSRSRFRLEGRSNNEWPQDFICG